MIKREYWGLDTETYKGRAFLLSYAEGVVQINSFADFFAAVKRLKIRRAFFYNIDYDVTALLAHLPLETCKRLYMKKFASWGKYRIEYLSGKFFSVSDGKHTLKAYDLYPFFQCSLASAALKVGLPVAKQKQKISMKLLRNLTPENYQKNKRKVDSYARQDAAVTQALGDFICENVRAIGLSTDRMYSPGFLAKAYLRKHNAKVGGLRKDVLPFVRKCYHGGMIQVFRRGAFKKIYVYDVKSSYPARIRNIPNISNARTWHSRTPESTFYFARARVWDSQRFPLLPFKNGSLTVFPNRDGEECYLTGCEADYLINECGQRVEFIECLNFAVKLERPFKKIVDTLYKKRSLGGGQSLLYKLILNSLYGVFAERIKNWGAVDVIGACKQLERMRANAFREKIRSVLGAKCPYARRYWTNECKCDYCHDARTLMRRQRGTYKEKPLFYTTNEFFYQWKKDGRFSNLALAAYITAEARIALHRELKRHPDTIAVFTDSLLLAKPSKHLPKSAKKIGQFELEESGAGFILGSGIYQVGDMTKFRGFHISESLEKILRRSRSLGIIKIKQSSRNSLGVVVRRGLEDDSFLNEIFDDDKALDINFDRKRVWKRRFKNGADALENVIESRAFSLAELL